MSLLKEQDGALIDSYVCPIEGNIRIEDGYRAFFRVESTNIRDIERILVYNSKNALVAVINCDNLINFSFKEH